MSEEQFLEMFAELARQGRITLSGDLMRGTFDEDGSWIEVNLNIDGESVTSTTISI